MRMVTNRRLVIGKDVYVGIDVHKESWQVTVRTDGEEISTVPSRASTNR